MKRFISLALMVVLVLGLCACGTSEGGSVKEGLQVGFGRENITPNYAVCLQGGSYRERVSTGFLDYVMATCVAVSEGDQTYLIYTMDLKLATPNFVTPAKERISQETGIAVDNIILNATHTHASVAVRYDWDNADKYREELYVKLCKAAKTAIEDMSAATVYAGSTQTMGMTWVRHYVNNDGGYCGANFGDHTSGYAGHKEDADGELQLVRFVREAEDKKDIVVATFPTHATLTEHGTQISSDFVGPFRDHIEQEEDVLVAYFIAAAGNQTPSSLILKEQFSTDPRVYGQELGRYALEGLDTLTKVEGSGIKLSIKDYTAATNKENMDKLQDASTVREIVSKFGAQSKETKEAVANYGFQNYLEASWMITRSKLPDTRTMTLRVMSIGDLSFVFAPYEMFSAQGVYIKENSPYDNTVIVSCSEGDNSYIPSADAFDYRAYESYVSYYAKGTAEAAAEEFVNMLTAIKGEA